MDAAPALAFAAVAIGMLAFVPMQSASRVVLLGAINPVLATRIGVALARAILDPLDGSLRLPAIGDDTAAYLYIWTRRLLGTAIIGYVALQVGALVGLTAAAQAVLAKALGLIVALLAAVFVLQNRQPVAQRIHRLAVDGRLGSATRRLGGIWHILVLAYLSGLYVVWAADIPGGFAFLMRGTLLTMAILGTMRLAAGLVRGLGDRLFAIDRDLLSRFPLLRARADRYVPALRSGAAIGLQIAGAFLILAAWRVDVLAGLASVAGPRFLEHLFITAMISLLGLASWEAVNLAITHALERRDEDGATLLRHRRLRTVLPLVRNAALVVICLLTGLTALSQLGVNVAPQLAGAGVVGIAVGFGAQTLVKDTITGALLLFEDAINVGDVVTINGTGGLVEAMTIRTIRLRDLSGVVHTIPFGAVTTVVNMTKDFSYYLLDVGVAYRGDTDAVVAALRAVFDDQRQDPPFASDIIGDLEVLGVDRFADSAVYVRARIKPIRFASGTSVVSSIAG